MLSRITPRVVCALAIIATGGVLCAGPLNPPSGAVTSTNKTLAEIEPRIAINATNTAGDANSLFKITAPGSYYLTGNITGVAGKHGIEITSSGVTLDLNGFDLSGVAGSLTGVAVTVAGLKSIAVLNGSIRAWGSHGIEFSSFTVTGCRVSQVTVDGCASTGIGCGVASVVSDCVATGNTTGIVVGFSSTVSNCAAEGNTSAGIIANSAAVVSRCSVVNNGGTGIFASSDGTVDHCVVRGNTADGIVCGSTCLITNNQCANNGTTTGANIRTNNGDNRIEGNNCSGGIRGIQVSSTGSIIMRNTCTGNSTNWDIVAGNALAPIVAAATNAAAVTGNTYAGTLGSTDPNANFTY